MAGGEAYVSEIERSVRINKGKLIRPKVLDAIELSDHGTVKRNRKYKKNGAVMAEEYASEFSGSFN